MVDATVAQVQTQTEPHASPLPVNLYHTALNSEQRQQLEGLLRQYSDVFSLHDFGQTSWVRHSIRTGDAPPTKKKELT